MKIVQNTTDFSNEKLREIINFVRPNNLPTSNFDVRVTNYSKGVFDGVFCGQEYDGRKRPAINVRVSNNENKFPYYTDWEPKTRRPYRKVKLYYDKWNEKTQQYETWWTKRHYHSIKDKEKVFKSDGYISSLLLTREEALVSTLAHELRHFWQSNHLTRRGKVWGARGKYSEKMRMHMQ